MSAPPTGLVRGIDLKAAVALVVGSMIGSGIFIVSSDIARQTGAAGLLLLVWTVTGVLTIMGALTQGELAAMYPRAGGQYVYLREGLSPMWGFLYGWTVLLVIQAGTIAAVAVAFARFTGVLVPALTPDVFASLGQLPSPGGTIEIGLSWQRLLGIASVVVLTWINVRGVKEAAWIQVVLTAAKVVALGGLIVLGLVLGQQGVASSGSFWGGQGLSWSLLGALGAAMVGSLFASDAWNNVAFAAAEVKNPRRNLPFALFTGTLIVSLLYLLANLAYLNVLTLDQIKTAAQDRVGTAAAEVIFGEAGRTLMAIAIMVSTFGCNNGLILAGARVAYAMARDGLFFRAVGNVDPVHHTPKIALWGQALWTSLLALSGSYSQLLDYVIFAAVLFYFLTVIALFRLRARRPDAPRPYRVVGYPWMPALYCLLTGAVMVNLLIQKPLYTWPGLIVVALGVPVYFLWRRGAAVAPAGDEEEPEPELAGP
jgi:APA family basic amino acid/polyamine antiporter